MKIFIISDRREQDERWERGKKTRWFLHDDDGNGRRVRHRHDTIRLPHANEHGQRNRNRIRIFAPTVAGKKKKFETTNAKKKK